MAATTGSRHLRSFTRAAGRQTAMSTRVSHQNSPLEGDGFELPVLHEKKSWYPIGAQLSLSMPPPAGLPGESTADFFSKRAYLRGCGGHAGVFDDAEPQRHRLRQCNTVADPGRRDRGTHAGKISGNVFGEPRTRRHSVGSGQQVSAAARLAPFSAFPPSPTDRAAMAEREPPRAVPRAPRSAPRFRRAAERRSRPDPRNRPDRRPIAPRASQAVRQNQNR